MLFDNNEMDFYNLMNLDTSDDLKLFNPKDGFLRGNMFQDEYKPYGNLTFVSIRPENDRERKLWNVMEYSFVINDLNLYLDLHPEDREANRLIKEMIEKEKMAKEEYTRLFGPLCVDEVKGNSFDWIDSPWPWEKDGGMYV